MSTRRAPQFRLSLERDAETLRAAQRLRYDVFVTELGAGGHMVDHAAELEIDPYDSVCDHLVLFDDAIGAAVGVYRLIRSAHAQEIGQFYSETEFDITKLKASGRTLLELGRSCVHRDYRGGAAMFHMWQGLADYADTYGIDLMFGTASFHGTDPAAIAPSLALLHHRHLAPEELRPVARTQAAIAMDLMAEAQIERRAAMVQIPALIKAYLRLGGTVGQGAYIDHGFNTIDVCLVLDTHAMNARQRQIYGEAK